MSNIITLNGNLEVEDWVANREEVLAEGNAIQVISNDADLDRLSQIVARAKKLVKKLSEKRKEVTAPADEFKKKVLAVERNETELLNKLIAHGDKLMGAYALAKARKAEEERRAIEAQQAAIAEAEVERQRRAEAAASAFGVSNTVAAPSYIPMPQLEPTTTRAKASNASFREAWTYEIINPNLVPRELCSPDPEKIKALLKSKKAEGYKTDEIVVQGLRISTTIQVRSR